MARKTNNAAYWAQRMKNMEDALLDRSYDYVENLEKQFSIAQAEIDRKIARWYQRFADNNEIDLAEAKKCLTAGELKEFHWTVEEYIQHGRQNALDGAWMKELENASTRVHISRLEALKLELQQQADVLYGNQLDYVDQAARQIYEESYYHTAFEVQKGLGVGCSMQALNERTIEKVLSRPWTADNQTFRDRCWTNKQSLVNTVNTQLTQMIIRGEAPDRTIAAIAKQFDVSKAKAGRLVMTESAYFSSAAQKDCFASLGVERYKIVASFDHDTCALCGDLDGKVFKMSEYEVGLTAPPFHPWCRCCTCPYFEDMEGIGERWTRNEDGGTQKVPADMTFERWKKRFVSQEPSTSNPHTSAANIQDITKEYLEKATPRQGKITYGAGYKEGRHHEETKTAQWLHEHLGGDITLLNESDELGIKMPDYFWRGKLWELKTTSTPNATDSAVRKALKQIQDNPGGIILDYGDHDIDVEKLVQIISRRIERGSLKEVDVIMLAKNQLLKVLRHKK